MDTSFGQTFEEDNNEIDNEIETDEETTAEVPVLAQLGGHSMTKEERDRLQLEAIRNTFQDTKEPLKPADPNILLIDLDDLDDEGMDSSSSSSSSDSDEDNILLRLAPRLNPTSPSTTSATTTTTTSTTSSTTQPIQVLDISELPPSPRRHRRRDLNPTTPPSSSTTTKTVAKWPVMSTGSKAPITSMLKQRDLEAEFEATILHQNVYKLPSDTKIRNTLLRDSASSFKDWKTYGRVFSGFVVAEAIAMIQSAMDEGLGMAREVVSKYAAAPSAAGSIMVSMVGGNDQSPFTGLAVNDLVLATATSDTVTGSESNENTKHNVLGVVTAITDRDRRVQFKYCLLENSSRMNFVRSILQQKPFYLSTVASLTTNRRQIQALNPQGIELSLRSTLLNPRGNDPDKLKSFLAQIGENNRRNGLPGLEELASTYNPSQARAILSTVAFSGFNLLLGPPGTGKSHTVIGALGLLLRTRVFRYSDGGAVRGPDLPAPPDAIRLDGSPISSVVGLPINRFSHRRHPSRTCNAEMRASVEALFPRGSYSFRFSAEGGSFPLLVCAPSNGAVDEIMARVIKSGTEDWLGWKKSGNSSRGGSGGSGGGGGGGPPRRIPCVVRVGRPSANADIARHSLDALVQSYLRQINDSTTKAAVHLKKEKLREELAHLDQQLGSANAMIPSGGGPSARVARLERKRAQVEIELALMSRCLSAKRKKVERVILTVADIVFTTLSSSALSCLTGCKFPYVIVDEAGQAVEPSTLIPLRHKARSMWLVGDPYQLAPTVISQVAAARDYNQTLFSRLMLHGLLKQTLTTQYRLHPEIRSFPSAYFYSGALIDAPSVQAAVLDTHPAYTSARISPYAIINVPGAHESRGASSSTQNKDEVRVVVQLVQIIQARFKSVRQTGLSIVIITPYRGQQSAISRALVAARLFNIRVTTVDGFQGQEADIVIFSTVRASAHTIGFLSDVRRMNVALTRARLAMYVVCTISSLVNNDAWKSMLGDAAQRGLVFTNTQIGSLFDRSLRSAEPGTGQDRIAGSLSILDNPRAKNLPDFLRPDGVPSIPPVSVPAPPPPSTLTSPTTSSTTASSAQSSSSSSSIPLSHKIPRLSHPPPTSSTSSTSATTSPTAVLPPSQRTSYPTHKTSPTLGGSRDYGRSHSRYDTTAHRDLDLGRDWGDRGGDRGHDWGSGGDRGARDRGREWGRDRDRGRDHRGRDRGGNHSSGMDWSSSRQPPASNANAVPLGSPPTSYPSSPSGPGSTAAFPQAKQCRFWRKGTCKRGSSCPFRHDSRR